MAQAISFRTPEVYQPTRFYTIQKEHTLLPWKGRRLSRISRNLKIVATEDIQVTREETPFYGSDVLKKQDGTLFSSGNKHSIVQTMLLAEDLNSFSLNASNVIKGIWVKMEKRPEQDMLDFRVSYLYTDKTDFVRTEGTDDYYYHEVKLVLFRSTFDVSVIPENGGWFEIEFDTQLSPWDGISNLLLEFSHTVTTQIIETYGPSAYFYPVYLQTLEDDPSVLDVVQSLPSDALPRTYIMQADSSLEQYCGKYPFNGARFVAMNKYINAFLDVTAAPGANRVKLTSSFSHDGKVVCCVVASAGAPGCSLEALKSDIPLVDWQSMPFTAKGGIPISISIEGPADNKLSPETEYIGYCAQKAEHL